MIERLCAREIIGTMKNMSTRPEFYSGRGAIGSDLDSKKLETIYQKVKREHGEKAAENFAQMVADIPVLSATDFLLTFYRLDSYGWKWDKNLLGKERGIDIGPDHGDGKRIAIGVATIVSVLGGMSDRDETLAIRGQFLREHGIKDPRAKEGSIYSFY